MNYYSNLGRNRWGLLIDDFLYNDQDMTNGQLAKVALIDSANVAIQLPQFVFENVLVSMQHEAFNQGYRVIKERNENGQFEIRVVNLNCKDVWEKLKPISFKIESTTITIEPRGYTYQLDKNQGYCQIGLQSIHGETSQYILGTVFLRNFYTVLDYDNDLIAIGVNKGSAELVKAEIEGHRANPKLNGNNRSSLGTFLLVLLVVFILVGGLYLILWRRDVVKNRRKANAKKVANADDKTGDKDDDDEEDEEKSEEDEF